MPDVVGFLSPIIKDCARFVDRTIVGRQRDRDRSLYARVDSLRAIVPRSAVKRRGRPKRRLAPRERVVATPRRRCSAQYTAEPHFHFLDRCVTVMLLCGASTSSFVFSAALRRTSRRQRSTVPGSASENSLSRETVIHIAPLKIYAISRIYAIAISKAQDISLW